MGWSPDDWCKEALGVDLGAGLKKIEGAASGAYQKGQAMAGTVQQGAASLANQGAAVVTNVAKKVQAAVSPPTAKPKPAAPKPKSAAPGPDQDGATSSTMGGSVGRGGKNNTADVKAVQKALGLADDGKCGPKTIGAIEAFQKKQGRGKADGRIDPGGPTAKALFGGAKAAPVPAPAPAPPPDAKPANGEDDGILSKLKKGASDLADDAKKLGGKVIKGVEEAVDDVKKLGAKAIKAAEDAKGGAGLLPKGAAASNLGALSSLVPADLKFHGEFPERKLYEFGATSKVKGAVKIQSEMTIELVEKGTNNRIKAGATANKGVKGEIELGKQKGTKLLETLKIDEVKELLNIEGSGKRVKLSLSVEVKFKPFVEGSTKVVKGSLSGVATGELKVAEVEWEEFKKDPRNFTVAGIEIAGGLQADVIVPLTASDATISLKVVCSGSVEPNWAVILSEAAKKGIEKAVEQGGRFALTVGAEVLITGSFIVAGLATIVAATYQIAFGLKLKTMTEGYAANLKRMEEGFRAGMSEAGAPGDDYGKAGHKMGAENFAKLVARTKEQNPQATDDQVKAAVRAKADDATREVINSGQVSASLKNGMWEGLLDEGKWLFTGEDASLAFRACGLGENPLTDSKAANSPQWKKYLKQYPTQSKL